MKACFRRACEGTKGTKGAKGAKGTKGTKGTKCKYRPTCRPKHEDKKKGVAVFLSTIGKHQHRHPLFFCFSLASHAHTCTVFR